jgi:hypothetical protein
MVSVRELSHRLKGCALRGDGAALTPEDVEVALASLRAIAGAVPQKKPSRRQCAFQIELIDDEGWPAETLAQVADEAVALRAFEVAVLQRPRSTIRLRLDLELIALSTLGTVLYRAHRKKRIEL